MSLSSFKDDDLASLLYTSGTTADPKGVMLTHSNLMGEVRAVFGWAQIGPEDAVLGVLPLFHVLSQMANLLLPLVKGSRVVYLETCEYDGAASSAGRAGHHSVRGSAAVFLFDSRAHFQRSGTTGETGKLGRANDDGIHTLQPKTLDGILARFSFPKFTILLAAKCAIW